MLFHNRNEKADLKSNIKEYAFVKWHTHASSITKNLKIKIYSTLPELSETEFVTRNCCVYDSSKGRYYMILVRDI